MRHIKRIIKIILIIFTLPLLLANFSFAKQISRRHETLPSTSVTYSSDRTSIYPSTEIDNFSFDTSGLHEPDDGEFLYTKPVDLEVKQKRLKKEDILKSVPSISTEDNKTLGLLIPPFAYFSKRF